MLQHASLESEVGGTRVSLMAQATERMRGGDWQGADTLWQQVLAQDPHHPEALYRRGMLAMRQGQAARALPLLAALLQSHPKHLHAWVTLGVACRQLGRLEEARVAYERVLEIDPRCADARFNLGNLYLAQAQFQAALQAYDQALHDAPQQLTIHSNRVLALMGLQRYAEALDSCDQLLTQHPVPASAYFLRGNVLMAWKRPEEALEAYDQALVQQPEHAAAHNNRGNALLALRRYAEALAAYEAAVQHDPQNVDARLNQACAVYELGQFEQALLLNDAVLAEHPHSAQAWDQRGITLQGLGRLDEAVASHDRALVLEPQRDLTRMNRGMGLLRLGRWREAWPDYEARWSSPELRQQAQALRAWGARRWQGSMAGLEGSDILLYAEQGLGDTLQACRYVSWVAQFARRVFLQVPATLEPVVQSLAGLSELVPAKGPWPRFDWHCPLMSLPGAARTEPDSVWAPLRYLRADAQRAAPWQARLGPPTRPRIGLMWRGGEGSHIKGRSIPLASLLAVLPAGPQYVSLQRELPDDDLRLLKRHGGVDHWGDEQTDFGDAAVLCEAMDLIITVDTSMAHLAGALGRPVWILLPRFCDWRWLQDRAYTPWYPSARLWRQSVQGQWDAVLSEVEQGLQACLRDARSILGA